MTCNYPIMQANNELQILELIEKRSHLDFVRAQITKLVRNMLNSPQKSDEFIAELRIWETAERNAVQAIINTQGN